MNPELSSRSREVFSRLKGSTTFYIVRHGESEGNREARIQGKTDLPLTDPGRDHARKAGLWLSLHPVDALFASPLVRASETASIIRSVLAEKQPHGARLEIGLDPDLEEIETGVFSGRTFHDLEQNMPDLWHEFRQHSWEAVPGSEKICDLEERALRVWNKLVDCANEGHSRIVAVSHGGFIHWLVRTSFSTGWDSWFPRIRISNCSVSELRVEVIHEDSKGTTAQGTVKNCMAEWYHLAHQPWA